MLGQVRRNEDSDSQWEHIKGRLLEYGTSPDSLDSIKAAFFEIQPLSRQKLEAAVKMLELIAFYAIDSEIIRLFDMEAVEKARHYMEANFRKRLSTGKIAGIVGLSISHFSYLFHKETGLTITRYLEKLRVDFAKSQLLSTSLSIKEIAADAGYGDQNYFSRVFKKLAGCSPANYRQEAGNIKKLC